MIKAQWIFAPRWIWDHLEADVEDAAQLAVYLVFKHRDVPDGVNIDELAETVAAKVTENVLDLLRDVLRLESEEPLG